ncbi:hypothetical protein T4D_12274 [Trichinella pseudospiralis]|uniref:Uncharacterized protein n=1 Tax=Trichinella pseudospiralis TaxID=6337 RepID=A0A0V1FD41_TRIPS|nr:hypothetical protein T4D_12274 [Trichinella pseudospiralis]
MHISLLEKFVFQGFKYFRAEIRFIIANSYCNLLSSFSFCKNQRTSLHEQVRITMAIFNASASHK